MIFLPAATVSVSKNRILSAKIASEKPAREIRSQKPFVSSETRYPAQKRDLGDSRPFAARFAAVILLG